MTLEKAIEFHIDTGSSYGLVVKEVVARGHSAEEVEEKIDSLVADGTLARGPYQGGKDMLVVRAWMPKAAAKMDEAS